MIVHQMDIVTVFLNGKLNEEIYMQQPDGYLVSGKENLVCRLKKSLYGLKQAPRCWNRVLTEFLLQDGFIQNNADHCVFTRFDEHRMIIAVYVDDLILISDVTEIMSGMKRLLSERFRMKDMGQLHYCLGVNIVYGQNCVSWLSKKQAVVALSMVEAEYVSLSMATQEAPEAIYRFADTNRTDCYQGR